MSQLAAVVIAGAAIVSNSFSKGGLDAQIVMPPTACAKQTLEGVVEINARSSLAYYTIITAYGEINGSTQHVEVMLGDPTSEYFNRNRKVVFSILPPEAGNYFVHAKVTAYSTKGIKNAEKTDSGIPVVRHVSRSQDFVVRNC